jgi:hypothetical protein
MSLKGTPKPEEAIDNQLVVGNSCSGFEFAAGFGQHRSCRLLRR